ncbi:hypothetical protein PSHT_07818 [Puccinia striiformis]|uniref:DNA polymerase alpha/delta/epsilon subunit B domain-containing protein n=1 Tax=Puccinia striiformis TaxID=27350 RepID=A0A2S4VUQ5_9BASI|nr:hypothetical protein PSHT_07818 [Puccinia striiformis]
MDCGTTQEICAQKWNQHPKPCRVLDINPSQISVVIGTLYCEMELKPNVLEDLAREVPLLVHANGYLKTTDKIMLEDESGRVRLVGIDRSKYTLVTGIIIGVLGRETSKGDFQVLEILYPGAPPQPPLPSSTGEQGLVAIVSGLDLNSNSTKSEHRADVLLEWLNGNIGAKDHQELARKVGRLIVAGNLTKITHTQNQDHTLKETLNKSNKRTTYSESSSSISISTTDRADQFMTELNIPIDLMPGNQDPTIQSLPQQLTHLFLGTSGQNSDDIFRYVGHEDRLRIAGDMLRWSHIAPTAPDTLHHDPFILTCLPHVYFIGNQPDFRTELIDFESTPQQEQPTRTRVILVPKFSKSGTVVLVDPVSLETQQILLLPTSSKNLNHSINDDGEGGEEDEDDDDDEEVVLPEKIVLDIHAGDDDDD